MSDASAQARDAAVRLLARRSHSSAELRLKLRRRGFADDAITQVMAECFARGYLNDEDTALRWAYGLARTKCWGKAKISAYLAHKGIDRETIEQVGRTLWQDMSEEEVARRALRKRFAARRGQTSPAAAAAFLKSRGFSAPVIYRVAGMVAVDDAE